MNALLGTIERETELVRAGKLREAMALESDEDRNFPTLCRRGRTTERQPEISVADRT